MYECIIISKIKVKDKLHQMLSLGAINKLTGTYVYPKIANKKDEYSCPDCSKDLILCQGDIRVHYFRHKVDSVNSCNHYSSPTESQIHKDAKAVLKSVLEQKTPLTCVRTCCCCKKNEEYEIPIMTESSKIQLEYRFDFNGPKIADVVYLDNDEIVSIFEICNTHKTCAENRPEPWFEIDAESLIHAANDVELNKLFKVACIRSMKCDECVIITRQWKYKRRQNAKDKLLMWLHTSSEIDIDIYRQCCNFLKQYNRQCYNHNERNIIEYDENDEIIVDYKNIADIAIVNNSVVKYAFKLNNASRANNIPEPWFYLGVDEILEESGMQGVSLMCMRTDQKSYCKNCRLLCEDWLLNLPELDHRNGAEIRWLQQHPCIKCGREKYNPIFAKGYRQLCAICLDMHEIDLKIEYDVPRKCLIVL